MFYWKSFAYSRMCYNNIFYKTNKLIWLQKIIIFLQFLLNFFFKKFDTFWKVLITAKIIQKLLNYYNSKIIRLLRIILN